MTLLISEIIDLVNTAKSKQEKIDLLRKHNCPALREVLKYAYHPGVKFFTNDRPNYRPDHSPIGLSFSSLYNEYKKLYIFLDPVLESNITKKGPTRNDRKMQILLQMLESIHPSESELLIDVMTKNMKKYKTINKALIEEALPGLLK